MGCSASCCCEQSIHCQWQCMVVTGWGVGGEGQLARDQEIQFQVVRGLPQSGTSSCKACRNVCGLPMCCVCLALHCWAYHSVATAGPSQGSTLQRIPNGHDHILGGMRHPSAEQRPFQSLAAITRRLARLPLQCPRAAAGRRRVD